MPELPEVENIRRILQRFILNRKIVSVQIKTQKIICSKHALFDDKLRGASVVSVDRKGKNLIFALSNSYFLIMHLGMTGQLLLKEVPCNKDIHTHLIIKFDGHPPYLIYRDIRKFGHINILSQEGVKSFFEKIGPDALTLTYEDFKDIIQKRKRGIKNFLLDQHFISGIGNIYSDEILYRAKIHPRQNTSELKMPQIKTLHKNTEKILKEAIEKGGSSVSNYLKPDVQKGAFQKYHRVYRREGLKCFRCSRKIIRIEAAQRGTYLCPHCQKLP